MTDEELFERARQIPGGQQAEFLRENGSGDLQFDRVMQLLDADEVADSLLDLPSTSDVQPASSLPAKEQIGNYKLIQKIGEGGMGSVYMAEQLRPVKRMVALKLVKAGMDSKQVIARFEAERQSLAMMDHPNIAKVLDAGSTNNGEPFFVMELVKGIPIHEYCNQNRLSTEQRVKLMVEVCSAVQHAHQKGIIHRDLKPSNILVAQYDDRPVPKVIDFGVAKATHQKLTDKTLYTQLGQIVGTLEYMSPEQAVLNQLDVDTRTDVYSLGVILYELLVGETPLNSKDLRSQGLEQILRTIREQEPARPSLRFSSQGEAAAQTAAYRKTDKGSLSRSLRGDLDWIVMKALEKDRTRRYDTASRMADDLSNYLNGSIVEARKPTIAYRTAKAWKRNRLVLCSSGAVIFALAFGLVVALWQNIQLTENETRIQEQKKELEVSSNALREEFYERILERVLSGGKIQAATLRLVDVELSEARANFIGGLLARNEGNHEQVLELIDKALTTEKETVAYRAMKFHSLPLTEREEEYYRGIVDLSLKQPTDYFDAVLLGGALAFYDPSTGIQLVEQAIKQHRNSTVAKYNLSVLYGHQAIQKNSLADIETALSLSNALQTLFTESQEYSVLHSWQMTVKLQLEKLRGIEEDQDAIRILNRQYAAVSLPDIPLIHLVTIGNYYILIGDFDAAKTAFSHVNSRSQYIPVYRAALGILTGGDLDQALSDLSLSRGKGSSYVDGVYAEALLLSDPKSSGREVLKIASRMRRTTRPEGETRNCWVMPETLLAQHSLEDAAKQARQRLDQEEYKSEWERRILLFWASDVNEFDEAADALFDFAKSSQHRLAEAYRIRAWCYMALGNQLDAIEYFEKAGTGTSASVWAGAVWCQAIAKILRRKL